MFDIKQQKKLDFLIKCSKWPPFALLHKQILERKLSATLTWEAHGFQRCALIDLTEIFKEFSL